MTPNIHNKSNKYYFFTIPLVTIPNLDFSKIIIFPRLGGLKYICLAGIHLQVYSVLNILKYIYMTVDIYF